MGSSGIPTGDIRDNDAVWQRLTGLTVEQPTVGGSGEATRSDHLLFRMNHEIRTAMNSFLGLTELLRESQLNLKQRLHVNLARASAHRLLQSTSEIVDLRRAELGNLRLCTISFDLHDTVRIATELLSVLAVKKKIIVRLNISDRVPRAVIGDPERLSQVVITLVRAAIDRMQRGEIWVNLDCDPGRVERMIKVTVADTGPELPAHTMDRVLGGILAVDGETEGDSGLALAFAKHLVQMMGGMMRVEHEPGLGTTFHFDVRVTVTQPAGHDEDDPTGVSSTHLEARPLKILVAEDAPDNLLLIRAFVNDEPWEIDSAENGRIAVQKAAATQYDLILMDIDMPEMDGHDATRQIRVLECKNETPHVPIVALTAHNEAQASSQSMEAGCSAHLTKPVRKADLIQAIQRYAIGAREASAGELR
jgi:CheY-like chemotaxis protein